MKFNKTETLESIASFLNATYKGDPRFEIVGLNEIHKVEKGDLTFVDHPKYYDKALSSAATTILINKEMEPPAGKALIFSEDPFVDFMKLIRKFRPFLGAQEMISQTARIGSGTIIQPGVFIGDQVKIGKNCIIHPNVTIYDHSVIGNHVIIHSGTVIGGDGFYFQKRKDRVVKFESCGRVVIHDHVEIGACCTVDRGVTGDTVIGEYTKFDNHIQVGHDTQIGKRCMFASAVLVAGVTRIEDDVTLWGQVVVNKDIIIHSGAIVLAVSAVDKTLEGNKTYFGAPAIEASKKWREMAMMRKLPEIYQKMK